MAMVYVIKGFNLKIDDALLDRLSKLSSLTIDDSKKESLKSELSEIVNFVENLNEVNVDGISATFSTIEGGTALREDEVCGDIELSNHIINHSPKSENGSFVVPKIIE